MDHTYRFLDINVGWPGSAHDARVLPHSSVYEKAESGTLLPSTTRLIAGENVPLYIIGDSAYPLLMWLMKPFPHSSHLSDDKKTYNYRMSRARIVVENAYGRLKGRWCRLMKKNEMNIAKFPIIIAARCTLHNMCEVNGDTFNENWSQQDPQAQQQPSTSFQDGGSTRPKRIREALVHLFSAS